MDDGLLEPRRIRRLLTEVGTHPDVPVAIEAVGLSGTTLRIELRLRYRKSRPVCRPEPSCYHRFLRPGGMRELADELRVAAGWLIAPMLEIVVTPELEDGFQFLESRLSPSTEPMTFHFDGS